MDSSKVMDEIKDAKGSGRDWREIAKAMMDAKESGAWRSMSRSPNAWLELAADASGYSVSILRRMISVYQFLERNADRYPDVWKAETGKLSFAVTEIFKRVHDADKREAERLAPQVASGDLKVADIKRIYTSLVEADGHEMRFIDDNRAGTLLPFSTSRHAVRETRDFIELASKAVEGFLDRLSGGDTMSFHHRHYKFKFASPDSVAIGRQGLTVHWVDAYDFKFVDRISTRSRYNQLIADIAFAATFFRHYWIVLPATADVLMLLIKDLQRLEILSVGVIAFDSEDSDPLRVMLTPELLPIPDRTEVSRADVMEQGVKGVAVI